MYLFNFVLFCFLLGLHSVQVSAQIPVKINGQINTASELILFSSPYYSSFLELTTDGRFEVSLIADSFPVPVSILTTKASGRVRSTSPTLWLVASENQLTLTATKKTMSYTLAPLYLDQEVSEQLENARGHTFDKLLVDHATKLPALYMLHARKTEISPLKLATLFSAIPPVFQEGEYGQSITTYLAAKQFKSPKKGDKIESFAVLTTNKVKKSIPVEHNKTRLVALLSPSCFYSFLSIDLLAQIHDHASEKVEVIAIWSDADTQGWKPAKAEKVSQLDWMLWDPYAYTSYYFDDRISPTFLIVNQSGVVVNRLEGFGEKTIKTLSALLNTP